MSYTRFALGLTASVMAISHPSFAQERGGASAKSLLGAACAGNGQNVLSRSQLAEQVFNSATVKTTAALTDSRIPSKITGIQDKLNWLAAHLSDASNQVSRQDLLVYNNIRNLEAYLGKAGKSAVEPVVLIDPESARPPTMRGWLFTQTTPLGIRCGAKAGKDADAVRPYDPIMTKAPAIAIRSKPEEFAVDPETRKTAGAFTFGYEKSWDRDPDTELRSTSTLSFSGAAGLRLTKPASESGTVGYAFARYDYKRVRTDPLPQLEPGKRREEDDTDVLELGGMLDTELSDHNSNDPFKVFLIATGGYVFDFAEDSEKIRSRALLELTDHRWKTPVCGFGKSVNIGVGTLAGRCLIRIDAEVGLQTKRGFADPTDYDDYFGIGPNFTYELFTTLSAKQQLIFTGNARYLGVIAGKGADIWRLEFGAKQRFWINNDVGFDIGATFVDGRNDLTLEKEKKLTFGLGLIL